MRGLMDRLVDVALPEDTGRRVSITDIRNSEKVVQVMQGGRLYDAATMNQLAPQADSRPPHFWAAGGAGAGEGQGWRAGDASTHGRQ